MALAVLVAEVTTVQHGFWIILGTLSVLRSNALGTGSTALWAVFGTVTGFVVDAIVLRALGSHDALLWLVLPVAMLVAAIAPTAVSFTVGQAGFTVFVVVIFNIVEPVGYSVGMVRIEDVAIGAGVSVVVGLLFWPRGAQPSWHARWGRPTRPLPPGWLPPSIASGGSLLLRAALRGRRNGQRQSTPPSVSTTPTGSSSASAGPNGSPSRS
jgi:uncharacterized membrane protein YccC